MSILDAWEAEDKAAAEMLKQKDAGWLSGCLCGWVGKEEDRIKHRCPKCGSGLSFYVDPEKQSAD